MRRACPEASRIPVVDTRHTRGQDARPATPAEARGFGMLRPSRGEGWLGAACNRIIIIAIPAESYAFRNVSHIVLMSFYAAHVS